MNKQHGNSTYIEPYPNPAVNGFNAIDTSNDHTITHSIRIEVYKGNEYQGKKIFSQERIIIGKSLEADLVLSDNEIAEKHAHITFIDEQPVILDQTQKAGMLIKGALCGISIIDKSEQVGLGPYTLKITHCKDAVDNESAVLNATSSNLNREIKASSKIDLPNIIKTGNAGSQDTEDKTAEPAINNEKPEVDLFSLLEGGQAEEKVLYDLVFEGEIKDGFNINKVKRNLSKIFKSDESRIEQFFNKKRIILKSALQQETAEKYKRIFEKSGAVCKLVVHGKSEIHEPPVNQEKPQTPSVIVSEECSSEIKNEERIETCHQNPDILNAQTKTQNEPQNDEGRISKAHHPDEEKSSNINRSVWKFYGVNLDDEDDEDEEDLPANFYLKDKIDDLNGNQSQNKSADGKYLEVLKLDGHQVIDIRHLEEKDRFYISDTKGKRFCLAEYRKANEALFSFDENLQGSLEIEGKPSVATRALMKDDNCISKRKGIYRTQVPGKGKVVLSDGYFNYQMRIVGRSLVPQIPEVKVAPKKSYRHIGVSFAFHIVFLTFLGLFPSFDNGNKIEEEPRFVQLDSTQLAELEKVMNPQPKPKPPEPPAVVEPELKKQAEPAVLKKEPVMTASAKKPSKAKAGAKPSRHPDAGGGFGDGNVATRNINETGILGLISDSVGIQPRNALAAVTNLDAVSSPNVSAGNLKVGGVVGKLGTGEIAVPKGAIISTKGSSQVLRSYGRKGEGTVAALEKGATGEQEVMGMVTATLDKSARIRGGLSMEAVKRVIDEHLDDITYCYETELMSNPSIVGKVMFEWKILMTGEVGEVRIKSSSINSHEIHACIKEAIRTWRFPKPTGSEVLVSYPFVFDIVGF